MNKTTGHDRKEILRTEDLTRRVGDALLVNSVSVAIHCCELVAVVGPSGAGKSSFLRLINRLDEPTGGTVYLNGQDYRSIAPRQLRQRVGMVMQSPNLFRGTVGENLRFGPEQRGDSLGAEELESLLERVGLAGYADQDVSILSGGEAQRVSLARTLANSPEVLLLDEPTSALDEATEREVEELVAGIIKEQGLTCLMVTHDMAQATRLASYAILMKKGRLIKAGPVDEVMNA